MRSSIKRQLLLPFAGGLAALAIAIGVGSVLAARGAANDELSARAERAQQLGQDTLGGPGTAWPATPCSSVAC